MKNRSFSIYIVFFACVLLQASTVTAQVVGYPGGGVLQAGDVWESFLPQGFAPNYSDAGTATTLGWRTFLRMGNFDRLWTTPGTHWPSAYPMTPYWFKNAMVFVYDTSNTLNPEKIGGVANPSYFSVARPPGTTNLWSNYAQLTYSDKLQGAVAQVGTTIKNGARNYSREPYWVDGTRRQHAIYEAAWPTNLGVDVKLRAHGFAGPNWNNLNDFVIIEIELKNTGVVDMNMDGIAEQITHDIQALAFQFSGEAYMSVSSYGTGARAVNDIVPTVIARQSCWIDDPDENGHPWAFAFYRAAPTTANPTAGNWDHGFNGGSTKNYADIYTGWVMIDAKTGGLPADASKSTCTLPAKSTIFGNHPIGTGTQRGWFVSGQSNRFGHTITDPMRMFYTTTAAYYVDCGKAHSTTNFELYNLTPNPNMFSAGMPVNPLTFVMKPSIARPNGSMQSTGVFDQVSTDDGRESATSNYPAGYGTWTTGASHTENFDGDAYSGIGPFSLKKDSVMTIVLATVAGYRLEGIQKAVRAARWAYEHDYVLPQLPPVPEMQVRSNADATMAIEWDDRAEASADFAGYKVWKAANTDTLNWLDAGMRIVDRYQEQMTPGARPAEVFRSVNPKFDAFAKTQSTATHGRYTPDTWGTWTLLKTVPKSGLAAFPRSSTPGYVYRMIDSAMVYGASYWYYVSAYAEGSYTGPGGETTGRIETHSTNRNGASGLWLKTYPFAPLNANYPSDSTGKKAIGGAVTPRVTSVRELGGPSVASFSLEQNYPNPFNPSTSIVFAVPDPGASLVALRVYDMLGREVATLLNEYRAAGRYAVSFDATGLASGVYCYTLELQASGPAANKSSGNGAQVRFASRKMLLVR